MIKRHYFFLLITQEKDSQYCNGVETYKSWFADPVKVRSDIVRDYSKRHDKDKSLCKIEVFNRV